MVDVHTILCEAAVRVYNCTIRVHTAVRFRLARIALKSHFLPGYLETRSIGVSSILRPKLAALPRQMGTSGSPVSL